LLLLLVAVTIILAIILQALPWYSCIAILTIIPVQLRLKQATGNLKNYLQLMATNLNSNLQTALLIVVALIVRGIAHV